MHSVGAGDDDCEGCEPVHGRSDEGAVLGSDTADGREDGPAGSPVAGDCDMTELTNKEGCGVAVEVLEGTNVKVHLLELKN